MARIGGITTSKSQLSTLMSFFKSPMKSRVLISKRALKMILKDPLIG
jgi:hypothetical protein